jgi:outer membrane protein OmpA-like peptidoglycan-associated protein
MTTPDDPRPRIDELLAAADRVASRPLPPPRPRWLPIAMLAIGGIVAIVVGVKLASGGSDSVSPSQTTVVPTAVTTIAPSTTMPVIITLPPTSPPTTPAVQSTSVVTTTPPSTAPTTTVVANTGPVRVMRYEAGIVHLEGSVPDAATRDAIVQKMGAVVGPDRVDDRYLIVAGTPLPDSEQVFFPDRFKFAPNSSTLSADDIAVLDLVMVFLVQNPQVRLDILAYTDSTGPDDSNLELSQTRADTIGAYLVIGGIVPERVTTIGMGETNPIASNDTEEGRAQNRRVEFVIHDLLG